MNIGKTLWFLQRYTAIYFLLFLGYIEFIGLTGRFNFQFFNENLIFKLLITLFIILACLHAFVGLWTIGTDYLTKRSLGFLSPYLSTYANFLRKGFELFFGLLGLSIVIFYLLIIWS